MTLRTLEKCPSNKEFTKKSGEMQGPTVGNLCTDAPSPKKIERVHLPNFFGREGAAVHRLTLGVHLSKVSVL